MKFIAIEFICGGEDPDIHQPVEVNLCDENYTSVCIPIYHRNLTISVDSVKDNFVTNFLNRVTFNKSNSGVRAEDDLLKVIRHQSYLLTWDVNITRQVLLKWFRGVYSCQLIDISSLCYTLKRIIGMKDYDNLLDHHWKDAKDKYNRACEDICHFKTFLELVHGHRKNGGGSS